MRNKIDIYHIINKERVHLMYKGYSLKLEKDYYKDYFHVSDLEIELYEMQMAILKRNLQTKLNEKINLSNNVDNDLDGNKLINDWFPNYKADIFISHSHDDVEMAKHLACWIERKFQLTTFIDSTVWGNSNDLLRNIDDKYAKEADGSYNYDIRNFTTSHVHMMLATALNDVIYSSECLIFLNTPQSLSVAEIGKEQTSSPWIYNELKTATTIKKIIPERHKESKRDIFNEVPKINYDVSEELSKFDDLDIIKLKGWQSRHEILPEVHPLDILYKI